MAAGTAAEGVESVGPRRVKQHDLLLVLRVNWRGKMLEQSFGKIPGIQATALIGA